ncbi:ribonuclease Y [Candidatus Uhrbacteria bacterium RIFCSPLOWO2_01_FULL_53_9]|uniref:Ribonuclease Y n=3 Tax=Candidatus Uhriibacteriota TaxID=1752732 RepID=A0A1F7UXN2_9BACT|nr:MAG: ribonuclease Y [Candidatus Uhrbacteria bacterium RIFCSPHIGHO2_02_FULL_53_13]OGL83043.1 MAG: ribonuclease Y [Candidatus Uhrbacteria bacterium RIFCSPLOWO2_01_FULL_53_9]OGL90148.1 MAG: ribonuclease Y [Candidatus Uhrbacteria bacterium RIFCSPLOWO2_02_FULL_53_10]
MTIISILQIAIGMLTGAVVGIGIWASVMRHRAERAENQAAKLIADAKRKQQDILLQAKEKAIKELDQAEIDAKERRNEIKQMQQRLEQRENAFDKKLLSLEEKSSDIEKEKERLRGIKARLEELQKEGSAKLEQISGLTQEEAVNKLLEDIQKDHEETLVNRLRKLDGEVDEALDRKAKKMLALVVERYASSVAVENTTTNVKLPNDEMKGRIIGKEGRNIKAIELLTGTEIIVDETPEMIMVSSFSPIRRQVAKRAIDMLVKDGRIQPARIEEAVQQAKKELAVEMKKAGEDALNELGIPISSIDPKLVQILGRLKFRTSYGQNQLQHAIEVAHISGMLAEELSADVGICKKGGLFHDIGKAVDHDMQGSHPEIGYNIMKKFGFPEEIAYQSIGHHVDKPKTLEAVIVKAADAISGARPGARKNSLEQYVQRLEELEATAQEFAGVEKAYAIQAGREVRVFVTPQEIDDFGAYSLAKSIAKKIEGTLNYPGEVKVTVIRETRVSEYAR